MQLLAFLIARLKEPSSYGGIALVLATLGIHFSAAQLDGIVNALVGIAGAAAFFLPETQVKTIAKAFVPAVVVLGSLLALQACGTTTAASVAMDVAQGVSLACAVAPTAEIVASAELKGGALATVTNLEAYLNGICGSPSNPTFTAATVAKVGQIVGQIQATINPPAPDPAPAPAAS